MIRISKTIVSACGELKERKLLPVQFDDATKANRFMDAYILKVFEAGKSGYDEWGSYWWGCDATPDNVIHRYQLDS